MKLAACRTCNAPIIWAITVPGGKRMPLDAAALTTAGLQADTRGAFALLQATDAPLAIGLDALPSNTLELEPTLRRSHFATCPNADEHRRGPGYRRDT